MTRLQWVTVSSEDGPPEGSVVFVVSGADPVSRVRDPLIPSPLTFSLECLL